MIQNEHVYAICCRPEVAGDVISGENVTTIGGYAVLNFEIASFNSFRDIQKIIISCRRRRRRRHIDDSMKRKRNRVSL